MKILLIEDDLELGNGVRIALVGQGFSVVWVRMLVDAQREVSAQWADMILLDLGLPDGQGLTLLKRMRHEKMTIPVLLITARDSLNDRVTGLDSGADDYLTKPFALAELISRIRALARRSYGYEGTCIEVRDLRIDETKMRVTQKDIVVELSRSEFDILTTLAKRLDRVVTRRTLEEHVLRSSQDTGSNVLDVHVSNLRKKIGDGYIRTVRGVGYVIDRL